MFYRITSFIAQHKLIPEQATVVLGFSGGPDSVFLLHVLVRLRQEGTVKQIIAAHLDHQWRSNSADDVVFCRKQADLYNVEFVTSTLGEVGTFKGSREEIGRKARRAFLTTIVRQHAASLIALGHHYDDQQETFFIRLLRGASLTGLTSMKPRQGLYIRPLLETKKADIFGYLQKHQIPYLSDPSNMSPEFLRNRIRQQGVPALRACDERFDASFSRTLASLQETENFLEAITKTTFEQLIVRLEESVRGEAAYVISLPQFFAQHPALQQRLLVHWFCQEQIPFPVSKGFFNEIMRFLRQPGSGKHQICVTWTVVKQGEVIFVRKDHLKYEPCLPWSKIR
jgi:tRNA(Ile)-lysidine synthase